MSKVRIEVVRAALNRSKASTDYKIYDTPYKRQEFRKQLILADNTLTEDEKTEAMGKIDMKYDKYNVLQNKGTKRICENCNKECLATLYCEYCIRNYLEAKFSNWTSGNDDIDNLIQKCQMETLKPSVIIEWIPYNKLENIKYLTKGGFAEIYSAIWIGGKYKVWNSKEQKLDRSGRDIKVILKRLENVENATRHWFEEAKTHLAISNKYTEIVQCYGLTQDPLNKDYMLVMFKMDVDLRKYLQQNHNQLTWKRFAFWKYIILKLKSKLVSPEVISGEQTTKASDIYSFAMLMWEISSGQPPFFKHEHDYNLVINIINGIRPIVVSGTPLEYKNLMVQCWDADPSKRPDAHSLFKKFREINFSYQNMSNESFQPLITNSIEMKESDFTNTYSKLFTSKVYQFENFPEPRNATEEEQEVFHSKPHDFHIPDNIDDFDKSNNQGSSSTSTIINNFEDNNKNFLTKFNELQINSENDTQNDYIKEITMQQQIKKLHTDINDEDDICNNPNFHSDEQNEFEIPDDI
ncbi:kinase-like domain-containing protein [Rhizophagus clarus]|uniref:Kinase-like domain-containing protein n=1 Tax=Rhizophagus clarus TaxID=94130 RepID=A0A8H3L3P2_9GLOM|nr:kinase-like domain-containing protein [Rhizophagus clarus]